VAVVLLATGAIASNASTSHRSNASTLQRQQTLHQSISPSALLARLASARSAVLSQAVLSPRLQAAGTATPTVTSAATPTATSTNGYPDPQFVLQNMLTVYDLVKTARFTYILDGEQVSTIKFHINVPGDAACKGPSMKGTLNSKQTLEGTSQSSTLKEKFIQIKTTNWINSKSTHNKWKKAKNIQTKIQVFGTYAVTNPLTCGTASQSGGTAHQSGGTDTIKDLQNMGPAQWKGHSVWDIRGIDVSTDSSGNTFDIPFQFLVDQQHYYPYVYKQTLTDTPDSVTLTNEQDLINFGEKLSIKKPV
jgi:hypothetical protein